MTTISSTQFLTVPESANNSSKSLRIAYQTIQPNDPNLASRRPVVFIRGWQGVKEVSIMYYMIW